MTDLVGQAFGSLLVIERSTVRKSRRYWFVKCSCGNVIELSTGVLRSGRKTNCGCKKQELSPKKQSYMAWGNMIARCHDPLTRQFSDYGGRGLKVCMEWRLSFEAFYADLGDKPSPEHTLDRIDNNKGYEPGNVQWSTRVQQSANRRTKSCITRNFVEDCANLHADNNSVDEICHILHRKRHEVFNALQAYTLMKNEDFVKSILQMKILNKSNKVISEQFKVHETIIGIIVNISREDS